MKPLFALAANLTLPAAALAAAPEPPMQLLLGEPIDRFLFLVLVWVVIAALVVVLRDRCRVADDLRRMGHGDDQETGNGKGSGDGGRGRP